MTTDPVSIRLGLDDEALSGFGVELWRVDLDASREPSETAIADLDEIERARLIRYLKVGDRARFAGLRSALRRRLGALLALPPRDVPIRIDARGRPHLPGQTLDFNLAHSGNLGLIAIGPGVSLGVDIEQARDHDRLEQMAQIVFSASERQVWKGAAAQARAALFLKVWTAKEAVLKATGLGFLGDPKTFSVLDADRRLSFGGALPELPVEPDRIVLRDVPVPLGYAAALCALTEPANAFPVLPRTEPRHD